MTSSPSRIYLTAGNGAALKASNKYYNEPSRNDYMSVAAGFKLHLDKERFLNNVYHDSSLPRKLDDVDTISNNDLYSMLNKDIGNGNLERLKQKIINL